MCALLLQRSDELLLEVGEVDLRVFCFSGPLGSSAVLVVFARLASEWLRLRGGHASARGRDPDDGGGGDDDGGGGGEEVPKKSIYKNSRSSAPGGCYW